MTVKELKETADKAKVRYEKAMNDFEKYKKDQKAAFEKYEKEKRSSLTSEKSEILQQTVEKVIAFKKEDKSFIIIDFNNQIREANEY